jgi:hypothetical protein
MVLLAAVCSVDEVRVLLFGGVEVSHTVVVEGGAEFVVFVELGLADHASCALAGETLADDAVFCTKVGGRSDYYTDEALAHAVNAFVRVGSVLSLFAGVSFEQARVEESGVGGEVHRQLVDRGRVGEFASCYPVDHVGQAGRAGVQAVDQENFDASVSAGVCAREMAFRDGGGGSRHVCGCGPMIANVESSSFERDGSCGDGERGRRDES